MQRCRLQHSIRILWYLALGAVLSATACASVHYDMLKDGGSSRSQSGVQVVMEGYSPGCNADPIGLVEAKQVFGPSTLGETIQNMKTAAAEHGANGIMDVRCAGPGEVGGFQHTCSGTAYVCR